MRKTSNDLKRIARYSPLFLSLMAVWSSTVQANDLTISSDRSSAVRLTYYGVVTIESGVTVTSSEANGTVYGTGATVTDIVNNGTIVDTNTSNGRAIQLTDNSTASTLTNNGTLSAYGHGIEIYKTSIGSITNTGSISAYYSGWGDEAGIKIDSTSTVSGNVTNSGSIYGVVYGVNIVTAETTVSGSVINTGSITGDSVGLANGGSVGAVDNSGTISGQTGVRNTGTITDFTNSGTITGSTYSIYNTGTITNGITNTGILDGDVVLGDAALSLVGTAAEVKGSITGSSASSVQIGDGSTTTVFTTAGTADAGTLDILAGATLELSSDTTWSADTTTVSSTASVILDNGSALGDASNSASSVTNNGSIYLGASSDGTAETATIYGNLINNGLLDLTTGSATVGSTLTVEGDYTGGSGSSLYLGTVFGDDTSTTDKLVVTGDATGETTVYFANKDGSGAQTLNGIEVISVGGTDTATFTQGSRIVAGAYDYSLVQSGSNWYLTSALTDTSSSSGEDGETSELSGSTADAESTSTSTVRPEAAAYAGIMMATNTLFNVSLHDYAGKTRYLDAQTGRLVPSAVWVRAETGYNHFQDASGQIGSRSRRAVLQMGSDLAHWKTDSQQVLAVGVMGGAGDYRGVSHSQESGNEARIAGDGYALGVYGRWMQHADAQEGAYADAWTQWNYFENRVHGDDLDRETYHSSGVTASVQAGYSQALGQLRSSAFWLQPKAGMTWMDVRAGSHTESNGTYVESTGAGNLASTVGLRLSMTPAGATQTGIRTAIESDWIHNSSSFGVRMNGTADAISGTRNIAQVKVAVEATLRHNVNLVADVAQQWGSDSYKDTSLRLVARVDF